MTFDMRRAVRTPVLLALLTLSGCLEIVDTGPRPSGKSPGSVKGYTDKVSYSPGESVHVYISATENFANGTYTLFDILGREVDRVNAPLITQNSIGAEPWKDGLGFTESFLYTVPNGIKSGIYFWERNVPFVVKSEHKSVITMVYPSNTVNAYTETNGRNLYTTSTPIVSFLRPQEIEHCYSLDFFKWMLSQEFDYRVIADCDLDFQHEFFDSQILIIPGHNEYWTRTARENFDLYVDNGGHALVLSGNTMWWQVRYENSALVCYKDKNKDPVYDKKLVTYLWNDYALDYPITKSIGADFDKGGYGLRSDKGWDGYRIVNATSPLLEGIDLKRGEILRLPTGEYDGAPIKSFDSDGYPIIDNEVLGFFRIELIGFDYGFRGTETVGTFFAFQKTQTSGNIINAGSIEWCSSAGIGASNGMVKQITKNMINKLLNNNPIFTP